MEKIIEALNELSEINTSYQLQNETTETLFSEIRTAKVCIPIIGKFSAGKSALMNAVLGYSRARSFLKEDIDPTTAVPIEITYSPEDNIYVVNNDGTSHNISSEEYRQSEFDATTVQNIRLNLQNRFLKEIPDIMLVDMPGYGSGFDVHDKAIDNYLSRSMAYMIAFPADDANLSDEIGNTLKELCLSEIPICIVFTKSDKIASKEDFDAVVAKLKENLIRYIGNRDYDYCLTSSRVGETAELKEYLARVQENARVMLSDKFRKSVRSVADTTEACLRTRLNSIALSESELSEKKEKLEKRFEALNANYQKEKKEFELQRPDCVKEVKNDIRNALDAEEDHFIELAMNNRDIKERINYVVRNAVTQSITNRVLPRFEEYLNRVEACISEDAVSDLNIYCDFDIKEIHRNISVAAVAAASAYILGPILAGILAGVIALIKKLINNHTRKENKKKIQEKLRVEVFPEILKQIGESIDKALEQQIDKIDSYIEKKFHEANGNLQTEIENLQKELAEEQQKKDADTERLKADLEKIQLIKNTV